ncbi:hypothetical protein ACFC4S_28660 [Priestia megaterium]|uniref:hypothetical protein n=1 Tax=Priestia megaterium TaxID=1404 RepID=UPI0035DDB24F
MNEMKLNINVSGEEITIGKLRWTIGPGPTTFDIPYEQEHKEENLIFLAGFQYIDFSEFLVLIEHSNPNGDSIYFVLDSFSTDTVIGGTFSIPEFNGGPIEFNQLVGKRLRN